MKKRNAKRRQVVMLKVGRINKPITSVTKNELADLMTVQEAAAKWGVATASVFELITRGRLTKVEMLGRTLLSRSEVENFKRNKAGRKPKAAKSKGA